MLGVLLFYQNTIEIAMTKTTLFKKTVACILTEGEAILTSSCQPTSPESYANKLINSQNVTVQGYNGRETVASRVFNDCGAVPANARRAMTDYIKGAEWKSTDYIRPQYFISVDQSFWAICIDNNGNMTGIIPFHGSQDARYMPASGHYKILVNNTEKGKTLSYAILKNLAFADDLRYNTRKAEGLDTPKPTPPVAATPAKPATPATPAKPAEDKPAEEEPSEDSSDEDDIDFSDDDF